ncbi:hypothetical protein BIFGAL_04394 [Bifidobacterium gallicum DSM 20093 = LMG 11596]|uniref:Uncharacterized protein n=1 Tax=Bifidobacterium gallicum DSM 20093 = LMG 11596 TaxID=561180 RepID=D1NWY7_9BIFI|nr:hypothetical protein BIFGAL_04394 [Bifidobacterium gallicum DSM 20093 = LMG 11596]
MMSFVMRIRRSDECHWRSAQRMPRRCRRDVRRRAMMTIWRSGQRA